jgi:hypothetical protein
VLELQEQGKPVYKAKSVSFTSLCDMYGASSNPLKDQVTTTTTTATTTTTIVYY